MRGIFFEEDDAREVASLLSVQGWSAEVVRERLAGEDDDEDHPWAVVSDAPFERFNELVEAHEGWLDDADLQARPPVAPVELPTAPKRIKRSFQS